MDNWSSQIIVYGIMAIFAENAIFSRGLGVERALLMTEQRGTLLLFGATVTGCLVPAGLLSHYLSVALQNTKMYLYAVRPVLFILIMIAVYFLFKQVLGRISNKKFKQVWQSISSSLHLAMFNSAVFGTLLLCSTQDLSVFQTLGFCIGSGIGFTIAVLYVAEGDRKLQNRNVPAAFKGMPVMLLYLGIISMCIYAFTGYQLAF